MKASLSVILFGAFVAICTTGCLARTAVVSGEHNAYVVKGNLFGSNMFHCTSEPKPVCKQVEESE